VNLALETEKRFGIKADWDALEKLRAHLAERFGGETPDALEKAFLSGSASAFLTVNETYFFREEAHFRFLRELLPRAGGALRLCSGAAASGCEAYSIAMLIEDYNKTHPAVSYQVDAFDVNPRVIEIAETGEYGRNAFRDDGSCFRRIAEPYISRLPGGAYRVNEGLKKRVYFFTHNVLEPFGFEKYDVIFFRNAFIYFTPQSKTQALSNIADALTDRGLLLTGVSETAGVQHPGFIQRNEGDVFYFEKKNPREFSSSANEEKESISAFTPVFAESFSSSKENTAKKNFLREKVFLKKAEEEFFLKEEKFSKKYFLEKAEKEIFLNEKISLENAGKEIFLNGKVSLEKSGKEIFLNEKVSLEKSGKEKKEDVKKEKEKIAIFCEGFTDEIAGAEMSGRVQRILESGEGVETLNCTDCAVSALYSLNRGDFAGAAFALDFIEKWDDSAVSAFLRGEYFFLQDRFAEAELYYHISFGKDRGFWPAGYRLTSLADASARRLRAEQTLAGIRLAQNAGYEVFIGGFSPDYYAGTLRKIF
jgi:chemotaxis protein methyltransferase CheR